MSVRIECCWATSKKYPSGWALTHAKDCPKAPGEKVRKPSSRRLRVVVGGGSLPTKPSVKARPRLAATSPHPACKAAAADGAKPCSRCAPILHPASCVCADCQAFDARSDEEAE